MNQLAREVWWYEAPRWAAAIGYLAEPISLWPYRTVPVLTISESTRDDLRRLGLRGAIDVMPMAVDTAGVEELGPRPLEGRLVAVGRLTPSKRYDDAIQALAVLRESHPCATLTIAGEGRDRERLERLAGELGLDGAVRLPGSISQEEKTALLTEADVLVGCSVREGWGLTVTEAARRGTPAVTYDIPGFRDSVADGQTGILTPPKPRALARTVARLLDDGALYHRLRREAWQRSLTLDWDETAAVCEDAIARACASRAGGPRR
jgi:glycosyltransferase involved in cell wall biosynthesis